MGKVCRRITWLTSINHRNCSSRASEGDRRGVTVAKMRITEDRESDRLQNCSSFLIMVASKPTVPRIATSEEASCGLLGQRCQHEIGRASCRERVKNAAVRGAEKEKRIKGSNSNKE